MLRTAIAAVFVTALSGVPAMAQESCACALTKDAESDVVGAVTFAEGTVFASQDNQLAPAAEGTSLFSGSQVITGPASQAELDLGPACSIAMEPNSEVLISDLGESLCVQLNQTGSPAANNGPPPANGPNPEAIAGLAVIGGGVGAALAFGGGDDDASD